MRLKETLKQKFSKVNIITLERYRASKFIFIISSVLFFLNFYFIGAGFHIDLFISTFSITYITLLLSIVLYIYFFTKKYFIEQIPSFGFKIILVILLMIFSFLILPVIISGGINTVIESISNYFNSLDFKAIDFSNFKF